MSFKAHVFATIDIFIGVISQNLPLLVLGMTSKPKELKSHGIIFISYWNSPHSILFPMAFTSWQINNQVDNEKVDFIRGYVLWIKQFRNESYNNLFFVCFVTCWVWRQVLQVPQINRTIEYKNFEVSWAMDNGKGRSNHSTVYKVAATGFIYQVYKGCDSRMFKQRSSSSIVLMGLVFNLIKLGLASLPYFINLQTS